MTRHPSNTSEVEEERQHFTETINSQWEDRSWNGVQESWDSNLADWTTDNVDGTPEEIFSIIEDLNDTKTLHWDEEFWEGTLSDAYEIYRGEIDSSRSAEHRRRSLGGLSSLHHGGSDVEKAVPRALGDFDDLRQLVESVVEDQQQVKYVSETKGEDAQSWNDGSDVEKAVPRALDFDDLRQLVESVVENQQQLKYVSETKGEDAQLWLDALQLLAELPDIPMKLRLSIIDMMLRLSKRSGLYPQCLMIDHVEKLGSYPFGSGAFGDVWKGKIGNQTGVCLKVVRIYQGSDVQEVSREFIHEAIVWQQLKHPNILPFIGMHYLNKAQEQLCLVSPYMERGALVQFLRETPREQVDHYSLVYDVASGLSYLHDSMGIVHGGIKGFNILITPDGTACIGGFGSSQVADTTSSDPIPGAIRWMAPELLSRTDPPWVSSRSSDIYAFGCLCYEIFAGNVPFHGLGEAGVILAVGISKEHPPRPDPDLTSKLTNTMWKIMEDCWNADLHQRPVISAVLQRVAVLKGPKFTKPASNWDAFNLVEIRRNVKYPPLDAATLTRLRKTLKSPA